MTWWQIGLMVIGGIVVAVVALAAVAVLVVNFVGLAGPAPIPRDRPELAALTILAAVVIGYWLVRSKALRFDRDATKEGL